MSQDKSTMINNNLIQNGGQDKKILFIFFNGSGVTKEMWYEF